MKEFLKNYTKALLVAFLALGMVANCNQSDDDDDALPLLALLATQQGQLVQGATVGEQKCDSTPTNVQDKTGDINSAETWSGFIRLNGTVTANAAITVEAGTVIYGTRGSSLFVLGANKLTAIGTKENPICWTSSNVPGTRQPGSWGGIVVVGNSGASRSATTEGTTPRPYGGAAGANTRNLEMAYNIVEFAGNEVAPGDELNGISMYASNTKLDNVQVHRGLDDSFEIWGGEHEWNKVIATGGLDDDFDLDEGGRITITNAISHKYPASCGGTASSDPHALEWDGVDSTSNTCSNAIGRCTTATLNKFVAIGAGVPNSQAGRLREGVQATLQNGVFFGHATGLDFRDGNSATSALTITNVRGQTGQSTADTSGATPSGSVEYNLSALPIVSDGGINTAANCGFSANKPDYSLTAAASSAQGPSQDVGKFWEGWTVYRAR